MVPFQTAAFGRANVHVLIPAGSEKHLPEVDPGQLMTFSDPSRSPRALAGLARASRSAIDRLKPDVVHIHSSFAGAVVRAMPFVGRQRPRMIYCPHGWSFSIETAAWKQRAYAVVERLLAARSDAILVNSQSEYDLARRFGIPARGMRVVKNGIRWAPLPGRAARTGPLRIAFVGRHDRQKGLDLLLDTLRRFPLDNIQFEIVGAGILQKDSVESRSAPPNATFHGWMSREATMALLETVDAVVMPSRWDAAPIVAIEAMRAGLPVIGSNRGSLPEIVRHNVGGYIFDLDSPTALGKLLGRLDRTELERLGKGARDRWEKLYVADAMNRLTCDAYDEVLTGRRAVASTASASATAAAFADIRMTGS
jgi:glycosyltransferase involved in cell wall biosynthesis